MRFLRDRWHQIGTKLYLALGFAVFLTLVSSAVGVYYFEQSGDLNDQVRSDSVPILEASWTAAREVERLRALGLGLLASTSVGTRSLQSGAVTDSLDRLDDALEQMVGVEELASDALMVRNAAYEMANAIDDLALTRGSQSDASDAANALWVRLNATLPGSELANEALSVLRQALASDDLAALEAHWDRFAGLASAGLDPDLVSLGVDEGGVFAVRGEQLALDERVAALMASFDESSVVAEASVAELLAQSRSRSSEAVELAVSSFDQGRLLLTVISVTSVVGATLAAWLWVGNGVVVRLTRLSDRMRNMAEGDLETEVPEVGRDEIGELAEALEVFRLQALEVQRLNLVEQLYEELRVANAELQRMQDRLVATEKLAALGELVSGVAHEMANPLNFVKNFSEGSLEVYEELTEMLDRYRGSMSEDDEALFDEFSREMSESLRRVAFNGGRALAIVERMRGLGVVGGEPVLTELNPVILQAAQAGCAAFQADTDDFQVRPVFDFDSSLGEVPLVESDFGEAVVNLVTNACHAMKSKMDELGSGYEPVLSVSSRQVGDMIEVRIRDNGPGISDDVLPRIFNPFFSTRAGAMGAGLGLPIAADVARRSGGDLSVDTVYGEYTVFTMSLPASLD